MRKIQCEVGVAYVGAGLHGGQWDTIYVVIPAVAEEQIEAFAIKKAKGTIRNQAIGGKSVAGLFLYHHKDYEGEGV